VSTPDCPAPQVLPAFGQPYQCPQACALPGARLFYRDEIPGSGQFFQYEIELLDPATGMVHVRQLTHTESDEFDAQLRFGGGGGGLTTPPGANAIFGGLRPYEQLICGFPMGCSPDGTALIPNGATYRFEQTIGFGTTYRLTLSCAGCGGGPERVNATWGGARCGTDTFAHVQKPCAGFSPLGVTAPLCCGCAADPACPAAAPGCVDGTCM
jgi:hypothetical protein